MNAVGTGPSSPQRMAVELAAFRRNEAARATQLRSEVPLMLARLAAEVPGSVLELRVQNKADGVVAGLLAVEAGPSTAELMHEVSAVLEPIAELHAATVDLEGAAAMEWPLVASARAPLGFSQDDPVSGSSVFWSTAGSSGVPELVALVSPYKSVGVRIRMRASDQAGPTRQNWDVDIALLTDGTRPSLRLRAGVRTLFPGLEVAADPGRTPAVLRVIADELPAAFAIPIAGEDPIAGTYVGQAAPLPLHPTRAAPAGPGSVRVGSAVTVSGQHRDVVLGAHERLRHVHVLGRTGTGKSSFLAGMANEVARTGDGMLVLDPHGPLVERIVAELPAAAADRTWVIRCGDLENAVPLNPMAVEDRVRREIAIDDLNSTFQYLFDPTYQGIVGPRFHERVAMALRALAAVHGRRASILDVPVALADRDFMERAAEIASDDRLKAWVRNDAASQRSSDYGEVVSWVNSKFESFTSTTAMRAILGSGEDAIDFSEAMDEGRIILVDLSKSDLGESATRLLGYLYLNEVWVGALQRSDVRRPFAVIVDEAQSLISGSLGTMLSEGRKFGLAVVLAHQYLGQLDSGLLPAVDGNVATTVAFRGAVADLQALYQRFGGTVDMTTFMTLPDLSAITLRTAADVTGEPYTLTIDHNDRVSARVGDELVDFSAELAAATARDLVDRYRVATAAAAEGKSVHAAKQQKPRPATRPEAPSPTREDSFLDEWLAKRQEAAARRAPAGSSDDDSTGS